MSKSKNIVNYQEELMLQSARLSPYLCFLKKSNKKLYKAAVEHYLNHMTKTFVDRPDSYTFKFSGGVCTELYSIYSCSDLGKPIIAVDILIDTEISQEVFNVIFKKAQFLNENIKRIHFFFPVDSHVKEFVHKLQYTNVGDAMIGLVKDSYQYLREFEYSDNVVITKLKKSEVEKVIDLELSAHGKSQTSRCSSLQKKDFLNFYKFCFKRKFAAFVAKEDGNTIGVIVVSISKDKLGHIMTVAVDPLEQKRGVSTLLYFHGMKYLKTKNVEAYLGVSSTSEVLKVGKKMGRHTHSQYLEVNY